MGANVSTQNVKAIYDQCTSVTNSVTTETTNAMAVGANVTQTITIKTKNSNLKCQNLIAKNTVQSNLAAFASMDGTTRSKTANDMASKIMTQLSTSLSQGNSGINLLQGNLSIFDSSSNTNIKTDIVNAIEDTMKTITYTTVNGKQEVTFDLEDSTFEAGGDGCTFTNEMALQLFSHSVVDQVLNTSTNNTVQDLAKTKIDSEIKQKNVGILSNPFALGGIGFGVVVVVIIIIIVVMKMKKNNTSQSSGSSGKVAVARKALKI
jgi:hypothetical protein